MLFNNTTEFFNNLIYVLPAIIIAFTIHEFAHAYTSYKLGDYLVKNEGRITLNPIKHIDPVGFVLLLLFGFGWAKPVEIHPHLYKNPVRDNMLVALSGPFSNIVLAIIGIVLNFIFKDSSISYFLIYFWFINIGLAIFNLLPIPPLDGSHILGFFMKAETYKSYLEKQVFGYILLAVILYTGFLSSILTPISDFIINLIYY